MVDRDKEGNSNTATANFRRCTEDDFRKNNYTEEIYPDLEYLICPDLSILE